MLATSRSARPGGRVLFLQVVEPGMYPPIIAAAHLMADAGFQVTVLASPSADSQLRMDDHPDITVHQIAQRPNYVVRKQDYLRYMAAAAGLALRWRPDVIYASDPLGAGPGLLASRLADARLIYHEHDTPDSTRLQYWLGRLRAAAARRADHIVFPNAVRAELVRKEVGFPAERLRIVWNMPRRAEIPPLQGTDGPLRLYFHGSITPERLPKAVMDAVLSFGGTVHLQIAGYEAPLRRGYLQSLLDAGGVTGPEAVISYLGQISRSNLLEAAASNHVGLAFMPLSTDDPNMAFMTGASNKAFDYMAAGLALLVSDKPDWRSMYVEPGFGLACDPANAGAVRAALTWFLDHPGARKEMAMRARRKIEEDWNYDTAFAPLLAALTAR